MRNKKLEQLGFSSLLEHHACSNLRLLLFLRGLSLDARLGLLAVENTAVVLLAFAPTAPLESKTNSYWLD